MMNLEDEKKLVAEKLMGWQVVLIPDILPDGAKNYEQWVKEGSKPTHTLNGRLEDWNPQSERKWWDEIWDKMGYEVFYRYLDSINEDGLFDYSGYHRDKNFHTAKPEVCWKALLKTLKEAE